MKKSILTIIFSFLLISGGSYSYSKIYNKGLVQKMNISDKPSLCPGCGEYMWHGEGIHACETSLHLE